MLLFSSCLECRSGGWIKFCNRNATSRRNGNSNKYICMHIMAEAIILGSPRDINAIMIIIHPSLPWRWVTPGCTCAETRGRPQADAVSPKACTGLAAFQVQVQCENIVETTTSESRPQYFKEVTKVRGLVQKGKDNSISFRLNFQKIDIFSTSFRPAISHWVRRCPRRPYVSLGVARCRRGGSTQGSSSGLPR